MISSLERQLKRKKRIRAKIHGTKSRPRFSVKKSNTSLYMQLIDDDLGHVLLAKHHLGKNVQTAKEMGTLFAKDAREKKITTILFDRSGYKYHGVIQALADALREGGLKF